MSVVVLVSVGSSFIYIKQCPSLH